MDKQELKRRAHDVDVTAWIDEAGIKSVVDELDDHLSSTGLVKPKFLRAARADSSTEEKTADLADRDSADLIDTRGHTAVLHR